ncbi:MAG: ribulose-phosphate 3-epimerase, partial [Brevinematales bacterium]
SLSQEHVSLLDKIRQAGKKTGLSLKPGTSPDVLLPYLEKLDLILVMTVEPGFSGQKFQSAMLPKIRQVRDIIQNRPIRLQVDGGVNRETYKQVLDAGADFLVIGSAFFADKDPEEWVSTIHEEGKA